ISVLLSRSLQGMHQSPLGCPTLAVDAKVGPLPQRHSSHSPKRPREKTLSSRGHPIRIPKDIHVIPSDHLQPPALALVVFHRKRKTHPPDPRFALDLPPSRTYSA